MWDPVQRACAQLGWTQPTQGIILSPWYPTLVADASIKLYSQESKLWKFAKHEQLHRPSVWVQLEWVNDGSKFVWQRVNSTPARLERIPVLNPALHRFLPSQSNGGQALRELSLRSRYVISSFDLTASDRRRVPWSTRHHGWDQVTIGCHGLKNRRNWLAWAHKLGSG